MRCSPIPKVAALVLGLTLCASASAENRWYGAGAGAAGHLAPTADPGLWVTLSAAMDLVGEGTSPTGAALAAHGTVAGYIGGSEAWAVMPLLSGDAGARLGPIDLFFSGGFQMFGFARRGEWTFFAPFGLMGGAGLSLTLAPDMRLALRGQVIWLPSEITARIRTPPGGGEKPQLIYLSGGLVFELAREFIE